MKKLERSEMKNLKGGLLTWGNCPVVNRYCVLHDEQGDVQFQCPAGCNEVDASADCRQVCGAAAGVPIF